jgi:hypothetical protein
MKVRELKAAYREASRLPRGSQEQRDALVKAQALYKQIDLSEKVFAEIPFDIE